MDRFCDLHTHSTYSDGTCTPAQILHQAEVIGLSAVALTDHNTVAGLPDFLTAARNSTVEAIPGVELSTEYRGKELHIVGLFLPEASFSPLTVYLEDFNRKKARSNLHLVEALNRAGYQLDYAEILSSHADGTVNRAVIAAALLEKGYVSSIPEAFRGLLSKEAGFFVPPERISALDAIALLGSLGAVSVLAHPFLSLEAQELRIFLRDAKPAGLAAMETLYATFSPEATQTARQIAREFGLLESGGSDFHGDNKPHIHLGIGKGNLAVPISFANSMKNLPL